MIEDADISFAPSIELPMDRDELLRELITDTPWRHESVTIWGKTHLQPRLIAWYGDSGRQYSYSGISLDPLPWTRTLTDLRHTVEGLAGETFNSVQPVCGASPIALYEDSKASIRSSTT